MAGLFSPEAIVYRREHGIRHQDSAMAVGVLAMVSAPVSGVMYTRDPEEADRDAILISAAWGLARTVVEGRSGTDFYRVARQGSSDFLLEEKIAIKKKQLVPDENRGEREMEVPLELQNVRCVSEENLGRLSDTADQIESYFRNPQDIEWSLDAAGGLVIIDIGRGVGPETGRKVLKPEQILSLPLRAFLDGLCLRGVWRTEPVDLDFRSFMTSFTRTSDVVAMNPREAQNLAVISSDYMNLNLRLGYHFNMIDTLVTDNRNENYIYFRFLGGVTDLSRRSRRAKFLAEVLTHFDFRVERKGDLVVARMRKIGRAMMQDRLEMLGRLVGYARQLDVRMKSDDAVDRFVGEFLDAGRRAVPTSAEKEEPHEPAPGNTGAGR